MTTSCWKLVASGRTGVLMIDFQREESEGDRGRYRDAVDASAAVGDCTRPRVRAARGVGGRSVSVRDGSTQRRIHAKSNV
ncbi:hypothetical protein EVAR_76216_1 [Eumeta japonica]|uniref:Uncharacterized protein n=1 Tax=Eumeta variegata TaxID=151549 RepID=A0A4C1UQ62_EUMVA|nr:hypothetical protein EVAR_76216_1 [Eumeta japonica]